MTNNSPSIRFKGFSDEWGFESFSSFTTVLKGKFNPLKETENKKCIELEHLSKVTGQVLGFIDSSTQKSTKNSFKKGDVLFGKLRPNLRKYAIAPFDGVCSSEILVLDSKKLNNEFLFNLLSTDRFYKASTISSGTKMPRADMDFINAYPFYYPNSIKEQQKIADFLSLVDRRINLLKEKSVQLLKYKKGVMQKVFSQDLRFKNESGNNYPEWQEFKLNQIATPVKRRLKHSIETVLTISAKKGFLLQADRFSQIIAGNSLEKYTHLKKGEFSYNRGNSKTHTYGCIYKLDNYEEALVPNIYRSFTINKGCTEFFAQLFKNKYLDRQLRRLISSSARMDGLLNIGEKDFYEIKVPFPSESEQNKIGAFLNELDKNLDLVSQQIEQTQTFKKGLLQQMFV